MHITDWYTGEEQYIGDEKFIGPDGIELSTMAIKLFTPLEQIKRNLKLSLKTTTLDQELTMHLMVAQAWCQNYCKRGFDGERLVTEYLSGNDTPFLNLKNYPILSISKVWIDEARVFDDASLLESTEYWFKNEPGQLGATEGAVFPKGEDNIKTNYYGGFIAEKVVVLPTTKAASHAIDNSLSTYLTSFDLFIKTSGEFTGVGGGIEVTGLDENGNSYSETVLPNVTDTALSEPTISYVTSKFSSITALDSSELTGAGLVSLTAVSMPSDLRHAISIITAYLYNMDARGRLGVKSRSTQGGSETLESQVMPIAAKQILELYRSILF